MPETVIIGAGPAGLAVGACLRVAQREFVLVERAAEVGSAWRRHYERLHLHTAKRYSSLPHKRLPKDWPTYIAREQFLSYLEEYAKAFELAPRLGEGVTRAQPKDGGWIVETSKGSLESRNLVIATGFSAVPHRPPLLGQFAGSMVHSAEYKTAAGYKGKRVLVVGAGNTGAEIALDLCEQGASAVDLCVRGPIHIIRRDIFGMPIQVLAVLSAWIPVVVRDVLFRALAVLTVPNLSRFGIRRPREGILAQIIRSGRIPLIDIGTVALIEQGRIRVRPDIRTLTTAGAEFTDGAAGEYDAIVLATGFRPSVDAFLSRAPEVLDERGCPRRRGRETELPGLYFVGFGVPETGFLREIGREAKRVAASIRKARR